MSDGIRFTKGHGTENDFVLILDRDGTRDLSPSQVVALAARGADPLAWRQAQPSDSHSSGRR